MGGDNTTQTTDTTQTTTQTPAATGETAGTQQAAQTTQTTESTPAPVVPDGYVPATEVETERTARTAAETRASEAETRAQAAEARARQTEIRAQARALGFHDPDDALTLVGADVELDKIGETLSEVVKGKSYLVKQAQVEQPPVTPTSPTNPARKDSSAPVFTQAQIADRAFWNANKAAILQAMKEGRIAA